jgi:hypothetical protein
MHTLKQEVEGATKATIEAYLSRLQGNSSMFSGIGFTEHILWSFCVSMDGEGEWAVLDSTSPCIH